MVIVGGSFLVMVGFPPCDMRDDTLPDESIQKTMRYKSYDMLAAHVPGTEE